MKNKKKILIIVVGILLTLGIVVGVSYAWWTHTLSQEGINSIQSTCLEIELADENPITLQNAYPITDLEAKLLTPYTFTIKNKCNTLIEYDVNLDIMESSNRLSSSYIAIEFNGSEKKLLNTLENVETSYPKTDYTPVEGRYLTSGELGSNESKSYSIKLWMDESVTVEDDAMNKSFISKVVVTAKQSHKVRLVDYVINDNEIEEFSHEATAQTKALTDYRYVGKNPNNYVYFGCSDNCTEDNLYRIIGVMPTQSEVNGTYENRVKLIKNSFYGETSSKLYNESEYTLSGGVAGKGYQWNSSNNNKWEESTLNLNVLNGVYWNELGEYQKYIATSVWYIGAPDYVSFTSNQLYIIERGTKGGTSGGGINFVTNIGLMYPSDYGYSLGNSYKDIEMNNILENYVLNAWLYNLEGKYFNWFISPDSGNNNSTGVRASVLNYQGALGGGVACYPQQYYKVQPTFYLKANVLYESGNGTKENPFRISINEK